MLFVGICPSYHQNAHARLRISIPLTIFLPACPLDTFYLTPPNLHSIQVLSKSVADGLAYFGVDDTTETEVFVRNFDRFFDCLNVRSLSEWSTKRKDDLKPYTSPEDSRLKV